MTCILNIIFIFCLNPLVEAVSLRIDGLIDLGPNWGYEYRILTPNEENEDKEVARFENRYKPIVVSSKDEHTDDVESEQVQAPAPNPNMDSSESNINRQPSQLELMIPIETHKIFKSPELIEKQPEQKNPVVADLKMEPLKEADSDSDSELVTKKPQYKPEKVKESLPEHSTPKLSSLKLSNPKHSAHKHSTPETTTWSSVSEESSSLDSWEKTTKKEGTRFDMYDFTTSRKPRKKTTPFVSAELSKIKKHKEKKIEAGPVNEDAISYVEDSFIKEKVPIKREKLTTKTVKVVDVATTTAVTVPVTNATFPTSPIVTTVRTDEIYSNPHKVKDDAKITEFTKHIYKQTLKVFDVIKKQTNEYHLRKEIDLLAKSYENKFKEFLRETNHQKIKTRLGTQKVILNTIDMSNRILKRLTNYMIGDMDKKGILRHNVATANIFQKEIEKELNLELNHACKKFGICRTGNGFSVFLTDVISLILYSDHRKFKMCVDALTEVVKNTDFNKYLERHTEKKLKEAMERIEMLNSLYLRTIFMVMKNIITHKNKPVIVNNNAASGRVNATLAFLEIIDLLDQHTPQNEANVLEWNDILKSLKEFADSERVDVQDIMESLIKLLKRTLKALDAANLKIINKNLDILLGKWS